MSKPKRTSEEYIQLNKKIIDKEMREIIGKIAKDSLRTKQEVCYDFIKEAVLKEKGKIKKI